MSDSEQISKLQELYEKSTDRLLAYAISGDEKGRETESGNRERLLASMKKWRRGVKSPMGEFELWLASMMKKDARIIRILERERRGLGRRVVRTASGRKKIGKYNLQNVRK